MKQIKQVLLSFLIMGSVDVYAQIDPSLIAFKNWCGLWAMKSKEQTILEQWQWNSNFSMIGSSSIVTPDGDTIPTETIQLNIERGSVVYIPTVKSQNDNLPVTFKLMVESDSYWRFENLEHDFPQVIEYWQEDINSLKAKISGVGASGIHKDFQFIYKRVAN